MERNTVLALVLIGAILLLTPWYMKKVTGVKPSPAQETTQDAAAPESVAETPVQTQDPAPIPAQAARALAQAPVLNADTLWVETGLYRGALSNVGGGTILHWELKKFLKGDKSHDQAVNLVPQGASGNLGMSLDNGMDLSGQPFEKVFDTVSTDAGREVRKVGYALTLPGGAKVTRTLTFKDGRYDFGLEVATQGLSAYDAGYLLRWNSGLTPTEQEPKDDMPYLEAVSMQGGELLKTKEKATGFNEGSTEWSAVRNKYFMAALVPRSAKGRGVSMEGEKGTVEDGGKTFSWKTMHMALAMGGAEASQLSVFIGPLDLPTVKSMGVNLEKVMNFGMILIKPFSVAFYYVLQALYKYIGNYGWAIIIFSILIKVALYPLTRKSFQSMRAMQELQPKIKAIQDKYKSDPQRMNQEVMKLYKLHGVNPMGGCLPMLLQMPVLFALFNLFRTTIMLRQASWLMISDLSAPDGILMGFNLLPILMGVTMILQQKLSSGQNPQQKAMAYMMPIMMTFMFYRISAGLNLYYMMFNVLTIAQELYVKRKKQEKEEA